MLKSRNIRKRPEDFIGWQSENGNLVVVGFIRDSKNSIKYQVKCKICSNDTELYPDYFLITKSHLLEGNIPCGCSDRPSWTKEQWFIRAKRAGETKRFIVKGFAESFKGLYTKINCVCLLDGREWTASLSNIINKNSGCPDCKTKSMVLKRKLPDDYVNNKAQLICEDEGYTYLGFKDGYVNQTSYLTYLCPIHGEQLVRYHNFINGTRCSHCAKENRKIVGKFYGFYPARAEETDYLYVLDFNSNYIKIGRSFNIVDRVRRLKNETSVDNINTLFKVESDHATIYNLEQYIHKELKLSGYEHKESTWSTETFQLSSIPLLEGIIKGFKTDHILVLQKEPV